MLVFSPKKILLIALLIASANEVALADGYYKSKNTTFKDVMPCTIASESLSGGFYLGGQVGYDSYWVRENVSPGAPVSVTGNPKINAPGWVAGLLLGYGYYFNDLYYLGGEVFGNYNQANESYTLTTAGGTYSSKFSANDNYGVSLLPGIKVQDDYLTYIRLGYNWANLKGNESAAGISTSNRTISHGFNYGLGIEALIIQNWSIRGEYTHTNYTSFTTSFGTNFDPSDNQAMIAVLYHFV